MNRLVKSEQAEQSTFLHPAAIRLGSAAAAQQAKAACQASHEPRHCFCPSTNKTAAAAEVRDQRQQADIMAVG